VASVSYDRVTKRFNPDQAAVRDFTLDIEDGEFMVLVGPSGCGKTTTLRMLAGLEDVTEGVIKIGDRVVNDVPSRDRDIAMVFQSYALYPHMNVYDNMAFGLRMRHTPTEEIKQRVNDVATMLGIESLLARRPGQLSGGQRQRVALGRAIVRQPQVFLLDEPLSNLDAALRGETRLNLQRLHRELRTTFVYVTHDQVEAMTMGTRIAVMNAGVLQQVATPRDLYEHPANRFVAGFIGSPPMNFVPARVNGAVAAASGFELRFPTEPGVESATLGIRPESLTEDLSDGRVRVEMGVDVVEVLGPDQYLYGRVGADELTARVRPDLEVHSGDAVPLGIDVARVHLFAPDGRTLL
jgi:multiple sugar transport system ATP-binding protein